LRAVLVDRWKDPDALRVSEAPEPAPGAGELAVRVRAAGLNFGDLLMVQGRYQHQPELPFVLGVELAGEVEALGTGVAGFAPGDRVMASVPTGAFAERAVVPADRAFAVPASMSFDEAAAVPIAYTTSYAALVFRARLAAGETLLVHAAAGGVGLAAVQIGRALGARVIAAARGAEKVALACESGAERGVDVSAEDFVGRVREATGGRGADVIYDSLGGDVTDRSLRCIAWNGRHLVVGFASGEIPSVRLNRVLLKNIALVGVHWPAYAEHEPARIPEAYAGVAALYERGAVRPRISSRHELEELPAALAALRSRRTVGKVVVVP